MLTAKHPWPEEGRPYPLTSEDRPSRPQQLGTEVEIEDDLWHLIQECWKQEETDRPRARTVVKTLRTFVPDTLLADLADPEAEHSVG